MSPAFTNSGLAANAPDVEADIAQSHLCNADLAPVPATQRKWGLLSFAALWISMSACITTYMLASSLIGGGMNWWEAVLTIFLGNLIVLVPMVLNAHAGTRYGIPFPVYCRASFGTAGANVPAILRLRLVRHPDLDRWRRDLQDWRDDFRVEPGAGDELVRHHLPAFPVLSAVLGHQCLCRLPWNRYHPVAAEHQGAAAGRVGPAAALLGL
jgi:hypothetical protein